MTESIKPERATGWEAIALGARARLVSAARRILRNREDAEDVADEVISRMASVIREGSRIDDIDPWLYRSTLHLAIDRARRWVMSRRRLADLAAHRARAHDRGPDEEAQRNELREEVWRRILDLPERQQQVLVLRDMEGHPFREVGRLLGIEESTARAQAHAARETLRRTLRRWSGSGRAAPGSNRGVST